MNSLRNIPAVDELLGDGRVQGFIEMYSQPGGGPDSGTVGRIPEHLRNRRRKARVG